MSSFSTKKNISTDDVIAFRQKMLDWYDSNRRVLPWRALEGEVADPYRVWLSEIMLQQTTVQAVIPYFLKFVQKWPNVFSLAHAERDDVMSAWAGLGYYARARNMHKCAQVVVDSHGGVFPSSIEGLKALPGIGDYTSAAIMAIAYDKPSVVVDGNVERVFARYCRCEIPVPAGKKILKESAALYSDGYTGRPGDYAQALMDLGATVCTPKSPACLLCPLRVSCLAFRSGGDPTLYPRRTLKKAKPRRFGYVYLVTDSDGQILVHRRPEKGLLGGMYGLPTSSWEDTIGMVHHLDFLNLKDVVQPQEFINHVFTHFDLTLYPVYVTLENVYFKEEGLQWLSKEAFWEISFPTVFKKAVNLFDIV